MALPYARVNFVDGATPLNATTLNKLDQGIKDLDDSRASYQLLSEKGAASGYASLGADGKVPAAQLPPIVSAPPPLPIQLTTPRTTTFAGNAFFSTLGLTAWDAGHWEFVKDVKGVIYGTVAIPPTTPATATIRLRLAASAAGVTHMECSTAAIPAGTSINPAGLTFISPSRDVTLPATAYAMTATTFALAAAPAGGSLLIVEIVHDGTHVNDTLAVNTWLLGAWLELT